MFSVNGVFDAFPIAQPLSLSCVLLSGIINLSRCRRNKERNIELWRWMGVVTHCNWSSPGVRAIKLVTTIGDRRIRCQWKLWQSYRRLYSRTSCWSTQLTMRLYETPMSWSEEDLEEWYYEYDEWYNGNAKKTRVDVEMDGSRVVFQSKDGVSAKAHLTQGCQVWIHIWQAWDYSLQAILTVELVGSEQSSALKIGGSGWVLCLDILLQQFYVVVKIWSWPWNFDFWSCFKGQKKLKHVFILFTPRTSSISFVILIAGLCVIVILGLLLIVCRVKALGRRQRLQVISRNITDDDKTGWMS